MGMHTRWYYLDDDSLVEYVPYEQSSKQQAINKMRSKLPKALSDERKRKKVEEKQRQVQQLEEELGKGIARSEDKRNKSRTYNLLDIKEAVEIKPQDYSKAINTKEFQFVQKPRDGWANVDQPIDSNVRQSKKERTTIEVWTGIAKVKRSPCLLWANHPSHFANQGQHVLALPAYISLV